MYINYLKEIYARSRDVLYIQIPDDCKEGFFKMVTVRNGDLLLVSGLFIILAEIVSRIMRAVFTFDPRAFTFLGPINMPKATFTMIFIISGALIHKNSNYALKKVINYIFIIVLLGYQLAIAYIDYSIVKNIYAFLGGLWVVSIGAVLTNKQVIAILLPYILIYIGIIHYNYSNVVNAGYDILYAVFFTTVSYCISRMIFSFTAKSYLNDIYLNESNSKLEKVVKELESLSVTDQLTGIHNRHGFEKSLNSLINSAVENGQPISMVMIDIDYFKNYNDFYGHLKGDSCLKAVARVLDETLGNNEKVAYCRYGGEEFIIALTDMSSIEVLSIVEEFKGKIQKLKIPHEKSPIGGSLSVTVGIATTILDDFDKVNDLIGQADKMLYIGKNDGRNRISTWEGVLE